MRILITGGTGFIGSRLALHCLGEGHQVLALGRPEDPPQPEIENAEEVQAAGGEVRAVHMTDRESLASAAEGRDLVFHMAATQHEMNVPDRVFRDVNAEGVRALMESCIDAGVSRIVHGSTIGVHGDGAPEPIRETSPLEPTNIYDVTKKEGEEIARTYEDRIETVILRIGETYGAGDRRLLKLFRGIRKRKFFLIGPGRNLHQPIHIQDLITALMLSATKPEAAGTTMLMAGPEALTTREMAQTVARVLDTKLLPVRAPMSLFLCSAFVLEKTLRPLGIQPPLHRRRMNFFRLNLAFSMDRAKEVLGFEPVVRFEEGARMTADWYREKGLLD
jgi:nucleoside-diphosphate-sugar epimerase